jgi:hypothetical protein
LKSNGDHAWSASRRLYSKTPARTGLSPALERRTSLPPKTGPNG